MKVYRYKKNGLLYTITREGSRGGYSLKAHPYKHDVEVGVKFRKSNRFRDFKVNMSMDDFELVSER